LQLLRLLDHGCRGFPVTEGNAPAPAFIGEGFPRLFLEGGPVAGIDLQIQRLIDDDPDDRSVQIYPVAAEHAPAPDIAEGRELVNEIVEKRAPRRHAAD